MNQPSEKCKWKYEKSNWSDLWVTTCQVDWNFFDGGPKENGYNFCPNCGKPVEVVIEEEEE